MKRFAALILCLCLTLCAVTGCAAKDYEKYTMHFYEAFDTITQIIGYAKSEEVFNRVTKQAEEEFLRLHRIFDRYNAYEGVNNLYQVNQHAAEAPTPAEPELIELLLFCKEQQEIFPNHVNVAMGAVLDVWHNYREEGVAIPTEEELSAAAKHCSMDDVIIDEAAGTVYFADPDMLLDVGSVAKGWATERVAQMLEKSEMPSFLISAGGNVRAGDPPLDGRLYWGVSIQDPNDVQSSFTPAQGILDVMYFYDGSAVTSGDYQRYYEVDGTRYHHIIDPATLMPSKYLRSVTIWARDSGMADFLSTTLFLMPYEEGRALVETLDGVEAYWVLPDGTIYMTDGMQRMAYSNGANSSEAHRLP